MNKTRHYIRTLLLMLLLLAGGGMVNDAWAKKVTYHILTLPFNVRNYNDTDDHLTNIRVEALQCTSEESTVGLPAQFVSPLAMGFRYWKTVKSGRSEYKHLYDFTENDNLIEAKYYIYKCDGKEGSAAYACLDDEITDFENTSTDDDGFPSDIYVTYEYNDANPILLLDGVTEYNVSVNVSGKQRFMCYNRSRNNRVANALSTGLSGEDLASDDFVTPTNNNKQLGWSWATWGPVGVHLGFKFVGTDPYNITITTSYTKTELHITDAVTNVDVTGTIKPYAGATLFGRIGTNKMWFDPSNDKHYRLPTGIKSAGQWTEEKYAECKTTYTNATDAERYETWVGFYRKEFPTINAYALLTHPNGEYIFVGSKMNQGNKSSTKPTTQQPNGSNQYATYFDNSNDPYFKFQAFSSAHNINFYRIRSYTLKLKTHSSNTVFTKEIRWSDARASERIVDHIPDELKRKYVKYTGAYKEETLTNAITTFADAIAGGTSVIWLKYETDTEAAPFEFLPEGDSYANAHWYTMRVNGKAEQKNIAYNSSNDFITGTSSTGSESNLHQGENSADAMVAFMGDPYELKIISRAASEAATTEAGVAATASHNRYIGCVTDAPNNTPLNTNKTGSSDISTWEIMYESTDAENFVLRQFNTVASPKYIGWSTTDTKPVIYSTTATRIRVVDLDKVNYTYHIINLDGNTAIKATVNHYVGKPLTSWTDIPAIIRSPFLANATVTYYDKDKTSTITNAPYNHTTNHDIYVRYIFDSDPPTGTDQDYNVTLNAEYIYTQSDDNIYSQENLSNSSDLNYQWTLYYRDPYAMKIKNVGKGKYIKISSLANNTALSWDDENNATLFIVKQSPGNPGFYEVMLATGDIFYDAGDGVGITTTYFNIGRNTSSTSENTVNLYQNTTYSSGYNQLRFRLIGTTAVDITYHLIDKANTDLLQVTTRHGSNDPLYFPPRYRSPLVSTYYYYRTKADADAGTNRITSVSQRPSDGQIYVTYDVNDLVDLSRGQLYLLKYENGDTYHQEDGDNDVNSVAQKAIYPYCNGDCNFFVYGQEQYDLQQEGAASTRTRWAWYVESTNNDPYHVKIMSRQSETYSGRENNAYFRTCEVEYNSENHVVTTLAWPGISGVQATEYMVLGNVGQYQLVTTNEISGSRYTVNSFEQYWKTFDTIRKNVYGDKDAEAKIGDPVTVPDVYKTKDATSGQKLRDYLKDDLDWHSYENWAYAKRWNGYNAADPPATSKGWENIEHWYQTVNMGEGYFDFVATSINPVLILLDQHGWEIMRKPLPTSPTDPQKDAKYEAIRPYNSPMVKEYAFWATAKKRSGFHQYYQIKDRIGDNYTSTDLTSLPPFDSKNVHDKKGNQNDQYVTYIVKDEYAQTYQPGVTPTAKPFLIEQGSKYASTLDGETITKNEVSSVGSMQKHITDVNIIPDSEQWYLKPNPNIDVEMGYDRIPHDWTNTYDEDDYKNEKTADYIDDKTLGQFTFSNGFDPYNIQISPKSYTKFMKTNATGAVLNEGSMSGIYSDDPAISLGENSVAITPTWYDSRILDVTNTTWMAVQDADGNMQLMPRFDHDRRMSEFGELIAPTSAEVAKTYTKLYRAEKYEYYIMDNSLNESIRYKSGGELMPQTPDRFKSPLATNFTYYTDAACTKKISESLDGVTLSSNKIYVRYEYNEEADDQKILMGNWQTMKLNGKDVQYTTVSSTAGIYYDVATSESKPSTVDGDDKKWQWKFLETPQNTPDPYAVKIYNRDKTNGAVISTTYALLPHIVDGATNGYMLAYMNGTSGYTYNTLTGNADNATSAANSDGNSENIKNGTNYDAKCKILLTNDVEHTFTYKVYTNSGAFAISANQTQEEVYNNDWAPRIPDGIKTPLLNLDQFRYYSKDDVTYGTGSPEPPIDITSIDTGKNLSSLYGLYDEEVVVRYTPYDPSVSQYLVPNVRNATGTTVAKGTGSNDTPLDLSQNMLYNVIWHNDNMMTTTNADGTDVVGHANQAITTDPKHEWKIGGNDPYAMKFYNVDAKKYITAASVADGTTCTLTDNATPFMLLPKDGYDYGILAITGHKDYKLTIPDDNSIGTNDAAKITTGDPQKFIIFALATHRVIYHLMIENIGEPIKVPYKDAVKTGGILYNDYPIGEGTTKRDLTTKGEGEGHIAGDYYQLGGTLKAIAIRASGNGESINTSKGLYANDLTYCYDAGHISLGDEFEVPSVFYRPNVDYKFIVGGVWDATGADEITEMNNKYKGVMTTNMGDDEGLLHNTVFINIVYEFADLSTNSGSDFVKSVNDNKWYTFETNDATPQLAQYTTREGLKTESGYATHYTNDYLWTPVGDPYGFKMYNRYACKNKGKTNFVMTTAERDMAAGQSVIMHDEVDDGGNGERDIYELIAISTTTPGYFRVHPMVNKSGVQYYMNNSDGAIKLSTVATEWTFGITEELMSPYYQGAGYVGGLNDAGKAAYERALPGETEFQKLVRLQGVVYNHDKADNDPENYIVHYAPGYYRLHSQPGSEGITTPRYLSGYKHKIERDVNGDGDEADAIPLHFYEQTSYSVNNPVFDDLGTADTDYTGTSATRGEIPLSTVTSDPASIFLFEGAAAVSPTSTMQTQGLYVKENKMTETAGTATSFNITDIGGGIVLLYNGDNYLSYDQSSFKYDIKYGSSFTSRTARWCMQPVQKGTTAGNGEMPLALATNDGKDGNYYTTFYAPFDVLLTDENDEAFVLPTDGWPTITPPETKAVIHPKKIGQYNTGTYKNQFIPARTPVIIRTKNTSGTVTLALPNTTMSSPVSCAFSGQYLEQMLQQSCDYMPDHSKDYVYVFGLASTGTFVEDGDFASNGLMTATLNTAGTTLGFFKNANYNHESSAQQNNWTLNNKYVYANKIYYRAPAPDPSLSRRQTRGIEFVPVIFDFDEEEGEEAGNGQLQMVGDNCVYDLQGRCVATEEMVKDGTWRHNLKHGIYILNGKKIYVK